MAGTGLSESISAGSRFEPVTLADADLPSGVCRFLLVGTAGAANLMQADGTIRTGVPLMAGYNPIQVRQVRTGTAASNIWAVY